MTILACMAAMVAGGPITGYDYFGSIVGCGFGTPHAFLVDRSATMKKL